MLGRRTSGKYGSATDFVANISAAGTVSADWLAGRAGTGLFATANGVNKVIETGRFVGERIGLHSHFQFGINPIGNFYKADIFIKLDNPFGGNHKKRRFGK
jgi:hypothetical protein